MAAFRETPPAWAGIGLALSASSAGGFALQQPTGELTSAELDFFEARIRPLLVEKCYECHSSQAQRLKGGLSLETRAGWEQGGESGAAIVPADPDGSLLVQAVRWGGELEMPPEERLAPAEIALLEEWVRRGAPDPRTDPGPAPAGDASREHWAFQPVSEPEPPAVADESWCRNAIDRFVLARLEAEGLEPAPEADRRTLLRRLSFDLIGLPPTPGEVAGFLANDSPDAWEQEIERLLASPHFGERQARAWLDLARYSDSNGLDENLALANAWRYRDWVVRAFNSDLPYDRFLTWQLAGDLLPEPADEVELRDRLVATGFLVLGPKMLAEQDKEKLVFDVVDEQLDVAFRAFQGLTLGCARCHDHKFDPLSQRDYTAVAGVFENTRTLANLEHVSRWNERELAPAAAIAERAARLAAADEARAALEGLEREARDALLRRAGQDFSRYLLAASAAARTAIVLEAEEWSRANLVRDESEFGTPASPVARTGAEGQQFAEYDLTLARAGRFRLEARLASAEARPVRVLLDGSVVAEAALAESTGSFGLDGQRWIPAGELELRAGRSVLRIERDGPVPHLDRWLLVPVEGAGEPAWPLVEPGLAGGLEPDFVRAWALRLESAERGADPELALWCAFARLEAEAFEARAALLAQELRARRAAGKLPWNPLVLGLLDGLSPLSLRELAGRYQALVAAAEHAVHTRAAGAQEPEDPALAALAGLVHGPASPFALPAAEQEALFPHARRAELAAARARLEEREREVPPAFDSALAVRDDAECADLRVFRRGDHLEPVGEPVPRGAPGFLGELVPALAAAPGASGRLELARWMLDPRHPLTARVAANRVWQACFGQGLVRTCSNFGLRGEAPSHPELLDWLAKELVRSGWSRKALLRLVCSSATYRQGCAASPAALAADPENRLFARANRRRLEAEALRDAQLAVAGTLERALGGTLLETKNGDYVTNDQSHDRVRYESPRRSLYLPIIRNAMFDLFATFDYPDPSVTVEARSVTTSPAQALYLLNAPGVLAASQALAESLPGGSDAALLGELYQRALQREPTPAERTRALAFLERALAAIPAPVTAGQAESGTASAVLPDRRLEVWSALAQTLLVSNEFLYVE
jgi:hypothetical protein